jgi:hypothetical protein
MVELNRQKKNKKIYEGMSPFVFFKIFLFSFFWFFLFFLFKCTSHLFSSPCFFLGADPIEHGTFITNSIESLNVSSAFSPHKLLMFLPVCEIHRALHFILTFFTFRAEARPISVARQTGWRRSLRCGSRHLRQSSSLRALVAQIHIN